MPADGTKLITAEEWAKRYWSREGTGGCIELHDIMRQGFAAWARDIQRNALEAAAKAVCGPCKMGIPLEGLRHVAGNERYPCSALDIHRIIPENPAPAGPKKEGGGAQ